MLLQEISQILAPVRNISTSQEEQILTAIKNIYAFREVIQEPKIQKKHHREDIEGTKEPWEAFDEEQMLELEIEEFLPCLSSDPEIDKKLLEDLHGMTRDDIQPIDNKQENQGNSDYIELWLESPSVLGIPSSFNTP
jgi:hypothetical protein